MSDCGTSVALLDFVTCHKSVVSQASRLYPRKTISTLNTTVRYYHMHVAKIRPSIDRAGHRPGWPCESASHVALSETRALNAFRRRTKPRRSLVIPTPRIDVLHSKWTRRNAASRTEGVQQIQTHTTFPARPTKRPRSNSLLAGS